MLTDRERIDAIVSLRARRWHGCVAAGDLVAHEGEEVGGVGLVEHRERRVEAEGAPCRRSSRLATAWNVPPQSGDDVGARRGGAARPRRGG